MRQYRLQCHDPLKSWGITQNKKPGIAGFFLPVHLRHKGQLGNPQGQPFDAVAGEIDLRARVAPSAFQGQHRAFTKLGMEHFQALAQTVAGLILARWRFIKFGASARGLCVGSS